MHTGHYVTRQAKVNMDALKAALGKKLEEQVFRREGWRGGQQMD
jgi:hypothetical protein